MPIFGPSTIARIRYGRGTRSSSFRRWLAGVAQSLGLAPATPSKRPGGHDYQPPGGPASTNTRPGTTRPRTTSRGRSLPANPEEWPEEHLIQIIDEATGGQLSRDLAGDAQPSGGGRTGSGTGRGGRGTGGTGGAATGGAQSPPPPPGGRRKPAPYQPINEPPLPDETPQDNHFSDEFLAPTSSNVYSFQYFRRPHDRDGILYVTFKASKVNRKAVRTGAGRFKGGSDQLHGTLGRTLRGGKTNEPGAKYAYFRVPPGVFNRMKAAHSKGKFVWDALRVRGTVWGHQYQYQLVQGQVTPEVGGVYIPRKATRKGFRTRSVAGAGETGRRGFQSSTLPQEFSSFRSRANPRRRRS